MSTAKNDWYMKNIIQPQIDKHLEDFEKEKIYDQNYNDKKVKQENAESYKKKKAEKDVFAEIQYQMEQKRTNQVQQRRL